MGRPGKQPGQARAATGRKVELLRESEIDRISDVSEHDERFIKAGESGTQSGRNAQKTKQMRKQDNSELRENQNAMYKRSYTA